MLRRILSTHQPAGWITGLVLAGLLLLWSGESSGANSPASRPTVVSRATNQPAKGVKRPNCYSAIRMTPLLAPVRPLIGCSGTLVLPASDNITGGRTWLFDRLHGPRPTFGYRTGRHFVFEHQIAINAP